MVQFYSPLGADFQQSWCGSYFTFFIITQQLVAIIMTLHFKNSFKLNEWMSFVWEHQTIFILTDLVKNSLLEDLNVLWKRYNWLLYKYIYIYYFFLFNLISCNFFPLIIFVCFSCHVIIRVMWLPPIGCCYHIAETTTVLSVRGEDLQWSKHVGSFND